MKTTYNFNLADYIKEYTSIGDGELKFAYDDERLRDPDFITPAMLRWIKDVNDLESTYVMHQDGDEFGWYFNSYGVSWHYILNAADTASTRPKYGEAINNIYTNEDKTIFTFLQTEETPIPYNGYFNHSWYYNSYRQTNLFPDGQASLSPFSTLTPSINDYILSKPLGGYRVFKDTIAFAPDDNRLKDPEYLTPIVLKWFSDIDSIEGSWLKMGYYSTSFGSDKLNNTDFIWESDLPSYETFSFCKFSYIESVTDAMITGPYLRDCEFSHNKANRPGTHYGKRNNFTNSAIYRNMPEFTESNLIDSKNTYELPAYEKIENSNYINREKYWFAVKSDYPATVRAENPSYFGTAREDLIRPHIYEMGNATDTYGKADLSNMLKEPVHEAHGIVWKVVVDGKDAQDEYEQLPPLGVGRHEFCVWFNRPMNVAKAPQISFGVRSPYSQIAVAEDGSWSTDSTKYTAYVTITGKTSSDGINQIYVRGAEDDEYFECPYENTRFRVQVQAAGSLATGFEAEPGLGKVSLRWNNENNDFSDAMGFNVYRYEMVNDSVSGDTLRLNREIIDADSVGYTDYGVTAGKTYYYYYKVLSTDLREYDMSNVVAAKVLTGEKGDANGSGAVDVADVITTVNYSIGDRPKPFLFEAADMNSDNTIDVLDVVGIIEKILGKNDNDGAASAQATATYSVEDGKVWVNSPVALAGVQVLVRPQGDGSPKAAADLDGFEQAGAWIHGSDYVFLGYNASGRTIPAGRHAILDIGDGAELKSLILSDPRGKNVSVEGEVTGADKLKAAAATLGRKGIYTTDGVKVEVDEDKIGSLPHGVYIINGNKVLR